jgi:CubicO group peptidase (beta-lactamase class C family)
VKVLSMYLRISRMGIAFVAALLVLGVNPACAAAADPFPTATPESQGLSSQALAKLLDEVRGFVKNDDIVGGELLVIKNRRTVLHEAVGLGDVEKREPLKPGTIYCIRSMTKPLIGAAVQILITEGRLSLDDTAARYLPSFDNDRSRGITVRHLLMHTSGLPFSQTNGDEPASLRSVADQSGQDGPIFPPGRGYQYSDAGANTLGAIVSVITGETAEAFIMERILEPLGMNDTFPLVSAAGGKLNRFTPAYRKFLGNWIPFWSPGWKPLFSYFQPSQSMYSSARDYARFLAMYLDGGRAGGKPLLSEAAVKRTLTPVNNSGAPHGLPKLTAYYGQMMEIYVDAEKTRVAFGHGGSDGTWAAAWPEHDLMVLYFTQSRGNETGPYLQAAIDRLLPGQTAAAQARVELKKADAPPVWPQPQPHPREAEQGSIRNQSTSRVDKKNQLTSVARGLS